MTNARFLLRMSERPAPPPISTILITYWMILRNHRCLLCLGCWTQTHSQASILHSPSRFPKWTSEPFCRWTQLLHPAMVFSSTSSSLNVRISPAGLLHQISLSFRHRSACSSYHCNLFVSLQPDGIFPVLGSKGKSHLQSNARNWTILGQEFHPLHCFWGQCEGSPEKGKDKRIAMEVHVLHSCTYVGKGVKPCW